MWIHYMARTAAILLKVFSIWFLLTAVLFWKKPKVRRRAAPKTRFACLIPARNEEAVIAQTVKSLLGQAYPKDLYDVIVIPNNCTDATLETASAAGAEIITCLRPVSCKGDVLRQVLEQLHDRSYDAYCVFDADNYVHEDFLTHMNDAFCSGARVAKGALHAKNPYQSAVSGCYALYYRLFDRIFNTSRANLGLSAKLVGTGFAFSRDLLDRFGGWPTETIAEDAEFSAFCAAAGERVIWVPEAITYDEAPTTFRTSVRQRMRWSSGIMCAAKKQLPVVLPAIKGRRPGLVVDSSFFLCAPAAQAISILPLTEQFISACRAGELPHQLVISVITLVVSAAAMTAAVTCLAISAGYKDKRIVKSVLFFPLFMASWFPIQVVSLIRPTRKWKPIRHEGYSDFCSIILSTDNIHST